MKNLAIFASGSGTNAENIARLFHQGNQVRVAVVLCNRKNAGVFGRMERLGVPCLYIPSSVWDSEPEKVVDALKPYDIDLVVLAGFMRTVQPAIIRAYEGRMVNIHPSLLPAYGGKGMYGHHVHEAVIAAGEKKSGVTVHYVTDRIDGGEIVMQQSVDITPEDTPETLEAKIHPVEYSLYPRAIVAALGRMEGRASGNSPAEPEAATPPETPRSVDSAWADTLHLKYDEKEAAERKARAEERARRVRAAASCSARSLSRPRRGPLPGRTQEPYDSRHTHHHTLLHDTGGGGHSVRGLGELAPRRRRRGGRAPRLVQGRGVGHSILRARPAFRHPLAPRLHHIRHVLIQLNP